MSKLQKAIQLSQEYNVEVVIIDNDETITVQKNGSVLVKVKYEKGYNFNKENSMNIYKQKGNWHIETKKVQAHATSLFMCIEIFITNYFKK
jgi:pheromone shutdown protein TraB